MISRRKSLRISKPISKFISSVGGGFSPGDLALSLWLKLEVLARTLWNAAGKQLNDSSGNGNNGELACGVAIDSVAANNDHIIFGTVTLSGDFTICWRYYDGAVQPFAQDGGLVDFVQITGSNPTRELTVRINTTDYDFSTTTISEGDWLCVVRS